MLRTARKSTWACEPKKKEKRKKKKARSIYQVADADSLNNLAQKRLQNEAITGQRETQLGLRLDLC